MKGFIDLVTKTKQARYIINWILIHVRAASLSWEEQKQTKQ